MVTFSQARARAATDAAPTLRAWPRFTKLRVIERSPRMPDLTLKQSLEAMDVAEYLRQQPEAAK